MASQNTDNGKNTAIISYLTIIGTIIAIILNNNKKNDFASFHIRQALGLWLTFFILGYVVGAFNSWLITFAFWMFFGVLFIYGFVNAIAGKKQSVPLIGGFFQKIFTSI